VPFFKLATNFLPSRATITEEISQLEMFVIRPACPLDFGLFFLSLAYGGVRDGLLKRQLGQSRGRQVVIAGRCGMMIGSLVSGMVLFGGGELEFELECECVW